MKKYASLIKWIGGIVATIITGVIVWWLTEGQKKVEENKNTSKDKDVIVNAMPDTKQNEFLLGLDIIPQKTDIGYGEEILIKVSVYDRNNKNEPIGNAHVEMIANDGIFPQVSTYPQTKYHGITNRDGSLSIKYEAPTQLTGGTIKTTVAINRIGIKANISLTVNNKTYKANQTIEIQVH
ncbi:MAG: hypothetical protein ABIN36_18900 [Ferruginibacter sp.]